MDPDMVRQQEEEELASRQRGRMKVKMPASQPLVREEPIIPRAEPHVYQASPQPSSQPPWMTPWAATRIAVSGSFLAAIGLFGGIMLGVKIGLIPEQRLAIGTGAGFFLGWQSMVLSLRRINKASLGRSMIGALTPTVLVLGTSVAGMVAAAHMTGISQITGAGDLSMNYWLIAGASMMAGTVLAGVKLYKGFSR